MKDFLEQITERMKEVVDSACDVNPVSTVKVNDVELYGISLRKENQAIAVTVWLEEYFEQYKNGTPMEEIVLLIYERIKMENETMKKLDFSMYTGLSDYELVRNRLSLKLVKKSKNRKYLMDKAYVPFIDFAVIFCIQNKNEDGYASVDVTKELLNIWNKSEGELFKEGLDRMMEHSPVYIKPLDEMLSGFIPETETASGMYVMTNKDNTNGAVTMLYPGILKHFAEEHHAEKVAMIPSSIHEWILIVVEEQEEELRDRLCEMIHEVNESTVSITEVLSDEPYIYSLKDNEIKMWKEEE